MKFNVNYSVSVRLTDEGRRIHRANHEKLFQDWDPPPNYTPPEEIDGWSTWQLWELMHSFGSHCYNGCRVPFETEIEICTDGETASNPEK